MFSLKDILIFFISLIISVVATVICSYFAPPVLVHSIYISIIVIMIVSVVIGQKVIRQHCLREQKLRQIGIANVEPNLSEGTSTEDIINKVEDNFYLLGRSGSRFIEAKNFELLLTNFSGNKPVRMLFLEPYSRSCDFISKERNVSSEHASDILLSSLKSIYRLVKKGHKIEVRFYDNDAYIPYFRVILVDDIRAYVSYYPKGETGKESFQLLLEKAENKNSLFQAFLNHAESVWNVSKRIEWEALGFQSEQNETGN